MEWVSNSWDDDIPNWMGSHKIHVPNHQPVGYVSHDIPNIHWLFHDYPPTDPARRDVRRCATRRSASTPNKVRRGWLEHSSLAITKSYEGLILIYQWHIYIYNNGYLMVI